MLLEENTLGELLSDPRIRLIAKDAIRNMDLSKEEFWNKTLKQIKEEHIFCGEISNGFRCLYKAADSGDWYYPLYSEEECAEDEARRGVDIIWLPSEDPQADERPFIFLVPGGGFMNVWSLTEGWPVADQFNRLGYHVFVLTYQVDTGDNLMKKNMEDFARALKLIREKAGHFHVQGDKYITCGFSAGGYLICLWNTKMGYPAFGMPKPQACFPVYPETSIKETMKVWKADPEDAMDLYGCTQVKRLRKNTRFRNTRRDSRRVLSLRPQRTNWLIRNIPDCWQRHWKTCPFPAGWKSGRKADTGSRTVRACAWKDGRRER